MRVYKPRYASEWCQTTELGRKEGERAPESLRAVATEAPAGLR